MLGNAVSMKFMLNTANCPMITGVASRMVRFVTAAWICSVFVLLGAVFGGAGAIVRLDGDSPDAVTVRDRAALIVNFGERPKARYRPRKKSPSTRMGIAALVRESSAELYLFSSDYPHAEGLGHPRDAVAQFAVGSDQRLVALLHVLEALLGPRLPSLPRPVQRLAEPEPPGEDAGFRRRERWRT